MKTEWKVVRWRWMLALALLLAGCSANQEPSEVELRSVQAPLEPSTSFMVPKRCYAPGAAVPITFTMAPLNVTIDTMPLSTTVTTALLTVAQGTYRWSPPAAVYGLPHTFNQGPWVVSTVWDQAGYTPTADPEPVAVYMLVEHSTVVDSSSSMGSTETQSYHDLVITSNPDSADCQASQ